MATALLIRKIDGVDTVVADIERGGGDETALPSDASLLSAEILEKFYQQIGMSPRQVIALLGMKDGRDGTPTI